MNQIKAKRLIKGDYIGLCAPSNQVLQHKQEVSNCIERLTNLGFKVVLGEHVYIESGHPTNQQRASDINQFFKDPKIKAIFTLEGGHNCNGILPYIDYQLIKSNPKIIMGLSDNTVLINAIYAKTGLITYHGNNALYLFQNSAGYEYQEFSNIIMKTQDQTHINFIDKKVVREGKASGTLIGGNLRCFRNLIGTPYMPNCQDTILLLEAFHITDYEAEYMLEHLKQIGMFNQINAIVVGYVYGLQHQPTSMMQLEEVILQVSKEYHFPIIKCNNFGHCIENSVFPIGQTVTIDSQLNIMVWNQ